MKKKITDYMSSIDWSDWDGGTFLSFRDYINNINIPENATIDYNYGSSIAILSERDETDQECEIREKRYKEQNKTAEERERQLYLELKLKYES